MEYIFNKIFLAHDTGLHPERAERLFSFRGLQDTAIPEHTEWIGMVHPQDYIDTLRSLFSEKQYEYAETQISEKSFQAACAAANAAVLASDSGGFALVRPPGHHAYASRGSGFCLINNMAVAAAFQAKQGKRVAILDFDGHFGNGTASIFYENNQVMYCSIHQHPAYPGLGMITDIGAEAGKGFTLNLPIPPGAGDDIFRDAAAHIMEYIDKFKPDMLAVSAGFDGHYYDPLLQLHLSRDSYYWIGKEIHRRYPRNFAVLEGGYNYEQLPLCIENFCAGVKGDDQPHPEGETSSSLRAWETYEIYLHAFIAEFEGHWKR